MSSFNESNALSPRSDRRGAVTDEPQSLSLLGGVAGGDGGTDAADLDLNSLSAGGKVLNNGTMLLLMIFVVAAGTIYAMRVTQGDITVGAAAKSIEAKVEQALAKLTKPEALDPNDPLLKENLVTLFKDTDEIVSTFSTDPSRHQVPINYVQKNPFYLPTRPKVVAPKPVSANKAEEDRLEALKNLENEFKGLQLQTVMQGRVPVAIINGELVQPGQMIGSFKVKSIKASELLVELENPLKNYTLSMTAKADDKKPLQRGPSR